MEQLSYSVSESEREGAREYDQTPLERHIEALKIKRESAPLYPQPIELPGPRFTGSDVGSFAHEVGPFFDVLFPEYSLISYRRGNADTDVFERVYHKTKPGWEQALDRVGDFMIGAGMVGLSLATELDRELRSIEIPTETFRG